MSHVHAPKYVGNISDKLAEYWLNWMMKQTFNIIQIF